MSVGDDVAAFLANAITALGTAGVTLPDRSYVTWGAANYECEALILAVNGTEPRLPGGDNDPCVAPQTLLASLHLVRCPPLGNPTPAAADLDAFGQQAVDDAVAMGRVVAGLLDIPGGCAGGIIQGVSVNGQDGDRVGIVVTFELEVTS